MTAAERCLGDAAAFEHSAQPNLARLAVQVEARLLIARGRPHAALDLLAPVLTDNRRQGASGRLIVLLILQALAFDAAGDRKAARQSIEEAVAIAAPEGYLRLFLREGAALAPLLSAVRATAPVFVDEYLRKLGAYTTEAPGRSSRASSCTPAPSRVLAVRLGAAHGSRAGSSPDHWWGFGARADPLTASHASIPGEEEALPLHSCWPHPIRPLVGGASQRGRPSDRQTMAQPDREHRRPAVALGAPSA